MNSLEYYIEDGADYINSYLRGEVFDVETETYIRDAITNIDSLFIPSEKDMVVLRGVDHQFVEGLDKGYISTSTDTKVASEYACGHPLLVILVPKNFPIIDVSMYIPKSYEREIILPRNSVLTISSASDHIIVCKVSMPEE